MKKIFAVLLALAMLLGVAAFAESADFVGVWYLNEIKAEDISFAPASFGLEMSMELREDGSAELISTTEEETQEGTWAIEGDGVTVTAGDDPMSFVLEDGNLVAESDGMAMVFGTEKAEVEVFEPAAPLTTAAEEDYAGDWTAFKINMDDTYLDTAILGEDITASITGTTIAMNGFVFSGETIETTYADGALSFSAEDPDSQLFAAITAQLLEDGNLSLTLSAGEEGQFVLIMSKAE